MIADRRKIQKEYQAHYRLLGVKKYIEYYSPKEGEITTDYTAHIEIKSKNDTVQQTMLKGEITGAWFVKNLLILPPWIHFQTPLWAAIGILNNCPNVESARITYISEEKHDILRPKL